MCHCKVNQLIRIDCARVSLKSEMKREKLIEKERKKKYILLKSVPKNKSIILSPR